MSACLSDSDTELDALIALFHQLFADSLNTVLVKGSDEPIYLPADDSHPQHRIIFAHGFYASALHEIAHWCVAGEQRRQLPDYGYWYKPDGRSADEQAEFERVEVTPQAYEWILTIASGRSFHFSADNLGGGFGPSVQFQQRVLAKVTNLLTEGLPSRLNSLVSALCQQNGRSLPSADEFHLSRQ
ncbi:elongation factor P hydroxylase [Pontibacter sp. JAM-7]|uniref:elongation factor P hydroxylase n=1 Tax=Pontibacter sp. JAM-7 TaxID=3366581 RepID=UPI003AF6AA17